MSSFPQIHPAISPDLKESKIAYRLLPFSIQPQRAPHIGVTHWHNYLQLWYSISDSYTININGEKNVQVPGQLTIIPPYLIHSFDSSESNPENLRHVSISLYDDLSEKNIAPLYSLSHDKVVYEDKILPLSVVFTGKEKERMDEIIGDLLDEFSKHHDMNHDLIYKNVIRILSIASEHSNSVTDTSLLPREVEQINLIHSATNYIAKNYNKDISIETLSSRMLMSQSSFSNKFKHTTGQTFLSYCKKTKIARAVWLLRLSQKSLSEIADECGFYDSTHLSHTIKSTFNTSPLVLREQLLEQNRTWGLPRHLESMQRLRWMNVMSDEEIAYFRRCAVGMPD